MKELCPWSGCYGGAYDRFGLFGGDAPTIMAHCVHSTGEEIDLMQARGVFIAHCAQSNTNLASGVAPVRAYLDRGIDVYKRQPSPGGSCAPRAASFARSIRSGFPRSSWPPLAR